MDIKNIFGANFKKGLLAVLVLTIIGVAVSEVVKYQNRQKITRVLTETKFASDQQGIQTKFFLTSAVAYYQNRSFFEYIKSSLNQSGPSVSLNFAAAMEENPCERIRRNIMGVVYMLGYFLGETPGSFHDYDDTIYLGSDVFNFSDLTRHVNDMNLVLTRDPLPEEAQQLVNEIDQLAGEWRNCSGGNN